MRAHQFIPEAAIGTHPKRPAREGSRPARGHKPEPRYKEQDIDEIAVTMPSPATRAEWAKRDAAANAAEAKRQELLKAQQLQKNTAEVDRLQKINHHSLDEGGAQGPTSKKVCLSNVSDEALGVSQLASCKSQGLRARDGKKSHLIGHGSSKVRITVGGKKIKGKAHGGPLPDYGTRKGQ